ncbi:helicase RepA family protein [Ensifer canadensis]|uniref:helicase RepA family protein n=1 Tax=Ensifer canadensis TaxID=555315 RepID=UPI0035E3E8CB
MHGQYQNERQFRLIHLSELDENEPEPETRVQRLMPRTGFATIYGPPGCGKTFWAIHLGLTVAAGLPFFGCETEKSGVVYIAAEAGTGIKKRIIAARDRLGITDAEFYLITEAPNLGFSNPNDSNRLISDIQSHRVPNLGMIFLDTVARVTPGSDENSVQHMGAFIANADRIARHFDCIVVGVHHTGKDDGRGMRGSSAINGATDCEWWVRKEEGGTRSAKLTKMRDGEGDLSMTFDLDVVEMADGTTTCVITELSQPEVRKQAPKVWKPTGATAIAFDALVEVVRERGTLPAESAHIPSRTPTVSMEQWKAHAVLRGICSSNEERAVNIAFQRATQKLLENKKIGTWNSHVWPVL